MGDWYGYTDTAVSAVVGGRYLFICRTVSLLCDMFVASIEQKHFEWMW